MTLRDAINEARSGKARSLRCPAHDDRSPSLTVRPGHGAAVLIKCHAGCATADVLTAGGLGWGDVCAPQPVLRSVRLVPVIRSASTRVVDDAERRAKRGAWPRFEAPTTHDLDRLAKVRGLSRAGLELAVERGILWIAAEYRSHRCWVATDAARMAAQARRLDGETFVTAHGAPKALTLPGSIAAWPVGTAALTDAHHSLLLTEGGPDLLAAHHFIVCEGREGDAGGVGILGSGCSIPEEAFSRLKGRRVRVAQHADESGERAAARWGQQLRPHVEHVDGISFEGLRQYNEKPVKDLNDFAHIHPDDFEAHRWIWSLVP